MATLQSILSRKGVQVDTIPPTETALDAAKLMNEKRIGALVIIDAEARILGMFTERDILTRIVATDKAPANTPVSDVLTSDIITASPQTSISEAQKVMTANRVRHLPVIDKEGKLAGMISIGDLLRYELEAKDQTISDLKQYVYQ